MIAFSGTMRQFQRAVAVHVLKKTMYDTLHQRSSAASHHYTAKLHGVLSDGHATIHRASTKAKKALTAKSIARAPYKLAKRASTSARSLFRKRSSSGESARAEVKGNRSRSATADSLDEADAPRESNADLDGGDGGDGDFEDAGGNFDSECTADP
jgi:IS30 family transposase